MPSPISFANTLNHNCAQHEPQCLYLEGKACHCAMPAAKVLEVWELRFSAEQIVLDHTIEVVVDEQRSIRNQERRLGQHVVDRRQ